jgi:thiamine-phosphate pyrophosphorylase
MRSKQLSFTDHLREAEDVARVCREFGAVFIVNDSPEIALRGGADGVHLGKKDFSPTRARTLLGPEALIGSTVNSLSEAERLVAEGVCDYAGVGPFRQTTTKKNLALVLAIEELRSILEVLCDTPTFVIGGMRPRDVFGVLSLGAYGVAVCSALFVEGEPVAENASRFLNELNSSRDAQAV